MNDLIEADSSKNKSSDPSDRQIFKKNYNLVELCIVYDKKI
jgi:hypothetical protein